jgi:hypothetical protein
MRMMKVSAVDNLGDLIEDSHEKYIDIDRIHELVAHELFPGKVLRHAIISGNSYVLTEEDYNRIKGILSNKFV